jgi:hypothetical protein
MRKRSLATALMALSLAVPALAGCGGNGDDGGGGGDEGDAAAEEATVSLEEVDGSGQTGEATLTASGNQTHVLILIDGEGVSGNQPARIYEGTCDNLGAEPAYELLEVQNSFSDTTVDVPLATLTASPHAIDLQMSPSNDKRTSCGNIGGE